MDDGTVRLLRTTQDWVVAGSQLRDEVEDVLRGVDATIEHIGSSSVPGLLAKPIVDLAIATFVQRDLALVTTALEAAGWMYRGDAGDEGGHVFVLESRPNHRVAHSHVVELDGVQFHNWVRFRDLLRRSQTARARYEVVKVGLAERHDNDHKTYTTGKNEIVESLLADLE